MTKLSHLLPILLINLCLLNTMNSSASTEAVALSDFSPELDKGKIYRDEKGRWQYPTETDLTITRAGYEPYKTVSLDCLEGYDKYEVSLFKPKCGEDGERLWSQTKLMFGLGIGVAGFIWLLPEDVSGWDKNDSRNIFDKWRENVKDGPVWDQDDAWINYLGHPYFGGVYYQVARKSGYNEWNAFVYSALMSTFYWEYGLEAFAEVPSIQDLIVTPVGGYFYGEWAFRTEQEILANDGIALGSKTWGQISLFLLDPVDRIGAGINSLVGREWVKTGTVAITRHANHTDKDLSRAMGDYWGVNVSYQF